MATFIGTSGRDTLLGGAENDLLQGLAGNDDLTGGGGDDTLEGGEGVDRLIGQAGNDVLRGGAGLDGLSGGPGDDLYDGGVGGEDFAPIFPDTTGSYADYATFAPAPNALHVDLAIQGPQDTGEGLDTFVEISDLWGSVYGDTFAGDALANAFFGGAGDDTLSGRDGADRLAGGPGDDRLEGGEGADRLYGGSAEDPFQLGWGSNLLFGQGGDDNLLGADGDDRLEGGAGDDFMQAFGGVDEMRGGDGADNLYGNLEDRILDGGAGNDVIGVARNGEADIFPILPRSLTAVIAGGGNDTVTLIDLEGVSLTVDGGEGVDRLWIYPAFFTQEAGMTIRLDHAAANAIYAPGFEEVGVELNLGSEGLPLAIYGGATAESLTAGRTDDWLDGGGGDDQLFGDYEAQPVSWTHAGGDDHLTGGAGDDAIDGRFGADTAHYSGVAANYRWTDQGDGSWTVEDLRAGAPDGIDVLTHVEKLAFADTTVRILPLTPEELVYTDYRSILRIEADAFPASAEGPQFAYKLYTGELTQADVVATLVDRADASTSVATLAYQFFTGATPSAAGLDYLVSPTGPNANNINSAYYQVFNLENRYINFAVNLGKAGEGRAAFEADYGGKSLFEATRAAYAEIFGATPTEATTHALIDTRADYFAYYGADGPNGIGTKAAMVGWLLAEAAKADVGVYAHANSDYLTDIADGEGPYRVELVGAYADPSDVYGG